jgi:hypothetical protein
MLVTINFPHGGKFDFAGGALASDYLDGADVKLSFERNEEEIQPSEWPALGITVFSLRLIAYLDKTSNKGDPKSSSLCSSTPQTKRKPGPEKKSWKATHLSSRKPG